MFNYDPSFEEASPRAMLIQLSGQKGDDFGHIRISFVRDAVEKKMNPDTGREEYHDGPNAKGYRRTSWSSKAKNAFMIEDLVIDSQMSRDRQEDRKPYGIELRYRDVFSIDRNMATKMADTLNRLDKKLVKLDQEFGYGSGDLATFITRVASIMGIKKFLTVKDFGTGNLSDSYCYKTWKATDIGFLVGEMVNEYYGVKND